MKKLFVFLTLVSVLGLSSRFVSVTEASAKKAREEVKDERVAKLQSFFKSYGSPLAKEADNFITAAEATQTDYRLLPAISMVESTGCRRIIANTFNCFGWGRGHIVFSSFSHSIYTIAYKLETLSYYKEWRKDKSNLWLLAKTYCTSNPKKWQKDIEYFMSKIN
jgi:hypothetical protein